MQLLERLGADTILHGKFVGNGAMLTARGSGALAPRLGETLNFAIRPEHVHLFDPETGARL